MTDEILYGLRQVQQYALNLRRLMSGMWDNLPERIEGSDRQGAVRVLLGTDGRPDAVQVVTDWQRRQTPESVGSAVVEAYEAAASVRMEAWARVLEQSDWRAQAERLRHSAVHEPAGAVSETVERDLRYTIPRPLGEVAEDMIVALDSVDRIAAESSEPVKGSGSNSSRNVVITVTKNALVSCQVDPRWASRQSSTGLGQALNEALSEARADLARAASAAEAGSRYRQLDSLFDEALAILSDPRRLAD